MSSASDDGSEYNPDRNHQHEEGGGSPEQAQSGRAVGKGKTSKTPQQAVKPPKSQNKPRSEPSNMPPLSPSYVPYPPQSLGASPQGDDKQTKSDRQQLYALLRQQVGHGHPQGVSFTLFTADHLLANRFTTFGVQGTNATYDMGPQQSATSGPSFGL